VGFLNNFFGYRWSLYLVAGGQLRYAMHENSVVRLVGYCMSYFEGGHQPNSPWKIYLNFNKQHQLIELGPQHFSVDGEDLSTLLKNEIMRIDPGCMVKGSEPIFEDAKTKKKLKITGREGMSRDQYYSKLLSGTLETQITFHSIMDTIFLNGDDK